VDSIADNRQSDNRRPLQAAAELAEAGYPVFPTTPDGKNPTVEGGFYAATTDHSQIAAWVREPNRKKHNVAFPTGALSGVIVIDADDAEAADRMRAKYGEPTVLSAHDHECGGHWYFRHPRNGKVKSNGGIQPGLDRKGDGGYALAPPSKGKVWVDGIPEIASLPVLPEEFWSKSKDAPGDTGAGVEDPIKDKAAEAIARHVSGMTPGGRHDHMVYACGLFLNKKLAPQAIEDMLISAWERVGGDLAERAATEIPNAVRTTQEQLRTGQNVKGGPSMDKLTPGLLDELFTIFGWEKGKKSSKSEGNQAQRLIGYAMAAASELFLDQNGTEHAMIDGAPVPLDSGCYGWLRRLFWEHEENAATSDLLGTVAGQLRAFAEVSGNERVLHLRAAQHEGAVYLYLGPGRVVRVDASGWDLDPNPPVMFRRVVNLKELPTPKRDGSLDLLDDFITAREDRDHRLAKAWLVLGLLADINRPILLAHGPQGATKSSVQRVLKNVIDPARPESLKLRDKDFEQNLNKAFIPFFDNVSTISDYMADELSKAVTGSGNAVRKLYADDEDVIREYRRAILLNGLVIPTEKADLIDRILPVALKRVPPEQRKTERRMQALFEERHPALLGAVLDALSGALANHEEIKDWLPRLADWAEYAIALYRHLGWGGYGGFRNDWSVIEEGQHAVTLEGSALAQAAVAVVEEHGTVQKSPSNMLKLLHEAAESEGLNPDKDKDFPKHANWVWRKLVPVVPTLESFRITASEGKDADKKRYIRLERLDSPDGPNPEPEDEGQHNESGDSTKKMLSPSDPHTYGTETPGTAETPYFSENRKYTEEQIGNTIVLQGGKNAGAAVPGVGEAYLSQPEGDTISDDALNEGGNAVTEEGAGDSPKAIEARLKREQIRAAREARGEPLPESTIEKKEDGTVVLFATDELGVGTIILELDKRDGSIGIDLETANPETGGGALNPEDGLIRTVQVARGDFVGVVDCFYADPAPLMKCLNGEPIDIEVVKGRLEKE
jgi:hypothetical protein